MKTILKLIAILGLMVVVIFSVNFVSAKNLKFGMAKPPFVFQTLTNGAEHETEISKDSETETNVLMWLKANSTGWKRDFNSYAPGKIIRGKNISINFLKDGVIVNFSPSGTIDNWQQFEKPFTEIDSQFLRTTEEQLAR